MARMLKEWQSCSIHTLRQAAEQRVCHQSVYSRGDGGLLWDASTCTVWLSPEQHHAGGARHESPR